MQFWQKMCVHLCSVARWFWRKKPRSGGFEKKNRENSKLLKIGGIFLVQKSLKKIIYYWKNQLFSEKVKNPKKYLLSRFTPDWKKTPPTQSENPKILCKISRSGNTDCKTSIFMTGSQFGGWLKKNWCSKYFQLEQKKVKKNHSLYKK